jgi:ATP-binding cassette subfamily D (ALD) long-chain fatty acid import protein
MEDVKKGHYQKKLVSSANTADNLKGGSGRLLHEKDLDSLLTWTPVLQGRGKVVESDEIRFDQVPLISPNGDVLIKSMSFNVEPGVSVAVLSGINGLSDINWLPEASPRGWS